MVSVRTAEDAPAPLQRPGLGGPKSVALERWH